MVEEHGAEQALSGDKGGKLLKDLKRIRLEDSLIGFVPQDTWSFGDGMVGRKVAASKVI